MTNGIVTSSNNEDIKKVSSTPSKDSTCPVSYYSGWQGEDRRLFTDPPGIIERLRTNQLLKRFLPNAPATVYDIGGGAGVYAFPLAQQGYKVHLIDLTPLHIQMAIDHIADSGVQLEECVVGDARKVTAQEGVADAVLLMGPLYHMKNPEDRDQALAEAYRILKPGGVVFAVAISRFAVYNDFGALNQLHDSHISALTKDILKTGRNKQPEDPTCNFFSYSAYFHHPDELEEEVLRAGFNQVEMLNVEGPAWLFSGLKETLQDESAISAALHFIEMIEAERSVMGASGHIMAVGKK